MRVRVIELSQRSSTKRDVRVCVCVCQRDATLTAELKKRRQAQSSFHKVAQQHETRACAATRSHTLRGTQETETRICISVIQLCETMDKRPARMKHAENKQTKRLSREPDNQSPLCQDVTVRARLRR